MVRGVGAGRAFLAADLCLATRQPVVVITYSPERARALVDDAADLLTGESVEPLFFPEVASALYDGVLPEVEEVAQRLKVLDRLAAGKPTLVVAPVQAVLHLTAPREVWAAARCELAVGQEQDRDALVASLVALGYQRVPLVEAPGQMATRGGLVDVFPPTRPFPVRVEFFGDEVESLRYFDPGSQRSTADLQELAIPPAGEVLLTREWVERAMPSIRVAFRREIDRLVEAGKSREATRLRDRMKADLEALEALHPTPDLLHYVPYLYPELNTLLDYMPEGVVVIDEPRRVQQAAEEFDRALARAQQAATKLGTHLRLPRSACLSFDEFAAKYLRAEPWRKRSVHLAMLRSEVPWESSVEQVELSTPPPETFGGRMDLLVEGIEQWRAEGKTVFLCSKQAEETGQALKARGLEGIKALEEIGEDEEAEAGQVYLAPVEGSSGFTLPSVGVVVLTSREIFGWQRVRSGEQLSYKPGFSVTSLRELSEGDYVVHIHHGIGIYRGLVRERIDGIEREYLLIEYAGSDRVYVPVTQLDRIQKYLGADSRPPTIHSLHSKKWERQKRRARRSALALAQELLMLYRAREQARGHSFKTDSPWLQELEASFRYEETPDQLRALEEIKADMASERPADRLVCGDVGFGKTEVALRAAFIAVLNGKQVAVLVPTTVLAEQHWHTFTERLAAYPVRVEMLSRFRSPAEQRRIIEGLKDGSVDIVIGTHRLLMSDVQFKDLGLVVIDDEQRFGVEQKERLKKLRHTVDVITLTATPIPRTLNMALSGIRDITVINDPPRGRLPVRTYVRERDDDLIREAINRELARGGQVYFVHNRVRSIEHVAGLLQRLVPQARIAIGHGQMEEGDLEQVMMAFYAHEVDMLVCTTIIESGLDVPRANTIIIDDADRLGLAQLYQLRGRVGRSDQQAYCYLLYRYPEHLTEDAERRLRSIEEFCELGSGLKVAMRALEIRGAGDILGAEQSGQLATVGLDLFCEMLSDSVRALRGDVRYLGDRHATIDLPVKALVPPEYIPEDHQRIAAYRRLGAAQSAEEVDQIVEELKDRYGPVPESVANLARLAKLRVLCWQAGVTELAWRTGKVTLLLDDRVKLSPREARVLVGLYREAGRRSGRSHKGKLARFTATEHEISFAVGRKETQKMLEAVEEVLGLLVDRAKERARGKRGGAAQPA
ncbi:MAG: transcription-repair coupling factor [Armatimonadetes bacterium]|nr:transcription-repair coupling factor [Armatimonadota bacterium]